MPALPTGTVTFLFTDIEASTRLWEEYPEAMGAALLQHDDLLRTCIESHGGRVFKTVGDAFCAIFSDPREALDAALDAQLSLREGVMEYGSSGVWRNGLMSRRLPITLHPLHHSTTPPLHTPFSSRPHDAAHGCSRERDGDYFGPPLNRVARLLAIGHGGQVLLSAATQELVRDHLPPGASLRDLARTAEDLGRPETSSNSATRTSAATSPRCARWTNPELKHNLPQQVTSFIGREKELGEIRQLLVWEYGVWGYG